MQETKRIQRALETAFNRSMFLISPVDSLPLPETSVEVEADVLMGTKFMSGQKVKFTDKPHKFSVGTHTTPSVMIVSCKLV